MIVPIIVAKPPFPVILKDDFFLLKSACVVFPDNKTHEHSIQNGRFETSAGLNKENKNHKLSES